MAGDPAQAAAQQTWGAMPWWQKALVSYGAGADSVVRNDVASPALWAAQVLGLAQPGTKARYDAQTQAMAAPFNSLPGWAPRIGSTVGKVATLLPAAMAGAGGAQAALAPLGIGGALGRIAPASLGGAATGALSPEDRTAGAALGALLPVGGSALSAVAGVAGPAALRELIRAGVPLPALATMFRTAPAAVGSALRTVRSTVPVIVRRAGERPMEVAKEAATEPMEGRATARVRRALGIQGEE